MLLLDFEALYFAFLGSIRTVICRADRYSKKVFYLVKYRVVNLEKDEFVESLSKVTCLFSVCFRFYSV